MSYKSNLQTNNTALNENNIDLRALMEQIDALPEAGGIELPELENEGTAADLLSGKQLIDQDGNVVTGTIETKTESNLTASGNTVTVPAGYYASNATKILDLVPIARPIISIDDTGLITASATQEAGYVQSLTVSATKQLTTQAATTITPKGRPQTAVNKNVYTTGVINVAPIPDEYVNVSTATATEDTVFAGQTFGADGALKTGTFTIESELTAQDNLIAQIQTALQGKASAAPTEPVLQDKTVTPTTSTQTVTYDTGYDGLNKVTVNAIPSDYIIPSGTSTITVNGTYDIKNYASAVISVESSGSGEGENETLTALMNGRIVSYTNNTMSSVRAGMFMNCAYMTDINLPSAARIADYAFYNCQKLTSVAFPSCTTLGQYTFAQCSSLNTVDFPLVSTIGNNAFYVCSKLTSISFPTATIVNANAFARCSALKTVDLPACTYVSMSGFASCSSLESINLPVCSEIANYGFNTCSNLKSVTLPACKTLNVSAFSTCAALETVSLPACTKIMNTAFMRCYNLKSLYLMGSSVCALSNSNVFSSTPIGGYSTSAGTYGSIYVPASLLTSYKAATNWTYFSSRFVGV